MNNKLVNGELIPLTPAEQAEKEAREKAFNEQAFQRRLESMKRERNRLLRETDHMFLTDAGLADPAVTAYRADLRTLFDGVTTVEQLRNITFPKKPREVIDSVADFFSL